MLHANTWVIFKVVLVEPGESIDYLKTPKIWGTQFEMRTLPRIGEHMNISHNKNPVIVKVVDILHIPQEKISLIYCEPIHSKVT